MSLPCFEDSRERFLRRRKQWLHLRPGGRPERSGLFRIRILFSGITEVRILRKNFSLFFPEHFFSEEAPRGRTMSRAGRSTTY